MFDKKFLLAVAVVLILNSFVSLFSKEFFNAPETEPSSVEEVLYLEAYTKNLRDAVNSLRLYYLYYTGKTREYYELNNLSANLEFLLFGSFERAKTDTKKRALLYRDVLGYTSIINKLVKNTASNIRIIPLDNGSFQFFDSNDIELYNKIKETFE